MVTVGAVGTYLGGDGEQSPGYQQILCAVHLRVREASEEQIAPLRRLVETVSPVGDALSRAVQATLTLDVGIAPGGRDLVAHPG